MKNKTSDIQEKKENIIKNDINNLQLNKNFD